MLFDNLTYQMIITIKNIVLTLIDEKVLLNTVLVRLLRACFFATAVKSGQMWEKHTFNQGSGTFSSKRAIKTT